MVTTELIVQGGNLRTDSLAGRRLQTPPGVCLVREFRL